jgi:hypothetical protein
VISTDSLTVLAMVAASGFATVRVRGRAATLAMAGVTGLLAALWLGEFGPGVAGAVVGVVAAVALAAGLVWLAIGRSRAADRPRRRRSRS